MNRRFCATLVAMLLLLTCAVFQVVSAETPNVILIMADDMGYECLESSGGTSYSSTLLDRLAQRGMRFTNCYSQPICTPSRNKIMTGRSNARNYRGFGILDPDEVTFGTLMQQANYRTCIAGKWQLSGGSERVGTTPDRCGFDESCMWAYLHDLPAGVAHTGGWEKPGKPSRYWHPGILQNGEYRPTTADDYGPDVFTEFILEFVETNQTRPFFVYYPMVLTHSPFYPTPRSENLNSANKFERDSRYYGDMISYTGHCVDRIVGRLDELGIAENSLVLFTADNGTSRSIISRMGNRVVPGGKGLPIDAGCHVPLIAYWKGVIKPGSVCTDLVEFSDFLPTVAAVGKAKLPSDVRLDGVSFLPQLLGESRNSRSAIFMHYDKDPHKSNPPFRRTRFAFDGRFKLYHDGRFLDVLHDIDEERPLDLDALDAKQLAIRDRLQEVLDSMPNWEPDNSSFEDDVDAATKQRLEQLQRIRQGI